MTKILLLYNKIIPSVRLCVLETFLHMHKSGQIEFNYIQYFSINKKALIESDIIIIVRADGYIERTYAKILKLAGKYLIYVLDDDLLDVPEEISSSKHYRSNITKKNIVEIMKYCDCLLCTSPILIKKYGHFFKKSVLIDEPASIISYDHSKTNLNKKTKIGFAGSPDRIIDVEKVLTNVVEKLLLKYKEKIDISFFGVKPKFIDNLNLKYIPYIENYNEYKSTLASLCWDIGLAPMLDTSFHRAKYFNKYIEYGAYGIVGVYSNLPPYNFIIRNNENGILCNNDPNEWVSAVSFLIDNPEEQQKLKANIRKEIITRFSINQISKKMIQNLPEILHYNSPQKYIRGIKFLRVRGLFLSIQNYFDIYGISSIGRLFRKFLTIIKH